MVQFIKCLAVLFIHLWSKHKLPSFIKLFIIIIIIIIIVIIVIVVIVVIVIVVIVIIVVIVVSGMILKLRLFMFIWESLFVLEDG